MKPLQARLVSASARFPVLQKLGMPIKPGNVLCLVQEPFPLDRNDTALPASWI